MPATRTAAALAAAVLTAGLASAAPAGAEPNGINGHFAVNSNGDWAKINERYEQQPSERENWTISTQCSAPSLCAGTVTSDAGWTAPIYQKSGVWYVKRQVENWEPCPDGTSFPGMQIYRFSRTTPGGDMGDPNSPILVGEDQTTGVSGACGISKPLFIQMPFKLAPA